MVRMVCSYEVACYAMDKTDLDDVVDALVQLVAQKLVCDCGGLTANYDDENHCVIRTILLFFAVAYVCSWSLVYFLNRFVFCYNYYYYW
jgi:hypothetical protein